MAAYYNEHDEYAAQWLRNLIAAGLIAPGDVDERSIEDVSPDDLRGYTQCHFFAGIGVWSLALRRSGWSDERPVWTGSCPCQPFSAAGKGAGFVDERHLWPAWHHLISQCRPDVIFGEQVASKDGLGWFDLVQSDLEGSGYAAGAVDLCAAGVGAPHIRQRLFFVAERLADSADFGRIEAGQCQSETGSYGATGDRSLGRLGNNDNTGLEGLGGGHRSPIGHGQRAVRPAAEAGESNGLGDTSFKSGERVSGGVPGTQAQSSTSRRSDGGLGDGHSDAGEIEYMADSELQQRPDGQSRISNFDDQSGRIEGAAKVAGLCDDMRPGPTNGLWRDADWLFCRDGKWRPVEPGTFPLAHGATARVGRLRAYGNAIVSEAAEAFIRSYEEGREDRLLGIADLI